MTPRPHRAASDLRGFSRLAIDATLGLTDLVEAMHDGIARPLSLRRGSPRGRTRGVTGFVYRSIRWLTGRVGGGLDVALAALAPVLAERGPSPRRESVVAALNGVLGDYLAATDNPLAIPLQLRWQGRELPLATDALAAAMPEAGGRIVLLVHGLCRNDSHWCREGHDHGAALASDLGLTAIYVRYNSGLHVSTSGRALAVLLEAMVRAWPVAIEQLSIVAHSMGGLVARSACHYGELAGNTWPGRMKHIVFLGTPHHGAPLERGGQWLHWVLGAAPYVRPLARLGNIRSAGITDLRHGNLLDEDWQGHDRFARTGDRRRPVPLPDGVACYAAAAIPDSEPSPLRAHLLGDGLVPLDSALGRHADPALALSFPADRQWIGREMNHLDLLARPELYARLRDWLSE